jgi:uncharacterized protein (DUF433 family)
MTTLSIDHIVLDDKGRPSIAGSRSRVTQIVRDVRSGLTPDRIHEEYPHLSLAQIYAALSYYHDHKTDIDEQLEEEDRFVERSREESNQPSREELVARYRAKLQKEPGES